MKKTILMTAILMSAMQAQAATVKEICKEHTRSNKAYNICVENAISQEHLATCADITLYPTNTFKTEPFKNCLKVAEQKKLSIAAIKSCGETSGTHRAFALCLDKTSQSN